VTYRARFSRRPNASAMGTVRVPTRGLPRVTHLLVLAHRIDGMIRAGEIRDWAGAARLLGVTRARMTHIANLLLLAPGIQEAVTNMRPLIVRRDPVSERAIRRLTHTLDWQEQERRWRIALSHSALTAADSPSS
jgi:hypothetical protein